MSSGHQAVAIAPGADVKAIEWINYHHLLYFRTVAKEGSITKASKVLLLAQPTISGQIRALEETLGEKLFARQGRNLVLTEFGRVVYRYADEIFGLGQEMVDVLKGRPTGRPARLAVGVSDLLAKLVVYRILKPAVSMEDPVQIVCRESEPESLLTDLSMHELDLVLTDSPVPPGGRLKAYSHLLGASGVTIFASQELASRYRENFPASLDGAPFLLPLENSMIRRSLDHWFDDNHIRPRVVAEFQDSALLKTFGRSGAGLFVAPTVVEDDVQSVYEAEIVGRVPEVQERFYAISIERKFKNPAVTAILEAARQQLFASAEETGEAA